MTLFDRIVKNGTHVKNAFEQKQT